MGLDRLLHKRCPQMIQLMKWPHRAAGIPPDVGQSIKLVELFLHGGQRVVMKVG